MRIGITCYSTYGGSGIVGSELAKELAARGHTVHIIARALPTRLTELSDVIQFHEVEALNYPLFQAPHYTLALAVKQAEIAERERLDLLHVHYAIPHSISGYLAREMLRGRHALPVVTTLHGTDITLVGNDPSYSEIVAFSIEQSDLVTAVSNSLRESTWSELEVSRDIEVIPNFLDCQVHRRLHLPDLRRRLTDSEPDTKILVHVSNFRPVKRIDHVMAIFDRVRRQQPARLLLVGDGPDLPLALRTARELGIMHLVNAVGAQGKCSRCCR